MWYDWFTWFPVKQHSIVCLVVGPRGRSHSALDKIFSDWQTQSLLPPSVGKWGTKSIEAFIVKTCEGIENFDLIYLKKHKIFGTCHALGRRTNLFIVWVLLLCIYYVSAWSWVIDQPIWVLVLVSWKLVFPFWTLGKKKNRHMEGKSLDNRRLWLFKIKEQLSADNFEGLIGDPQYKWWEKNIFMVVYEERCIQLATYFAPPSLTWQVFCTVLVIHSGWFPPRFLKGDYNTSIPVH